MVSDWLVGQAGLLADGFGGGNANVPSRGLAPGHRYRGGQAESVIGVQIVPHRFGGRGDLVGGQHIVGGAGCQFVQCVFADQIRVFEQI